MNNKNIALLAAICFFNVAITKELTIAEKLKQQMLKVKAKGQTKRPETYSRSYYTAQQITLELAYDYMKDKENNVTTLMAYYNEDKGHPVSRNHFNTPRENDDASTTRARQDGFKEADKFIIQLILEHTD